jgi:hypothetical protein
MIISSFFFSSACITAKLVDMKWDDCEDDDDNESKVNECGE